MPGAVPAEVPAPVEATPAPAPAPAAPVRRSTELPEPGVGVVDYVAGHIEKAATLA